MNPPDGTPAIVQPPWDNRSPTPEEIAAFPIWIWTDGVVGGPFPLSDLLQLDSERGVIPGMLARVDGGSWLPWPDVYTALQAGKIPGLPEPAPTPPPPTRPHDYRTIIRWVFGAAVFAFCWWLVSVVRATSQAENTLALIAVLLLFTAFYFLPSLVAAFRGHHNAQAICVVNLFLGWTFIGWVVSLAWAFTAPRGKGF